MFDIEKHENGAYKDPDEREIVSKVHFPTLLELAKSQKKPPYLRSEFNINWSFAFLLFPENP